MPKVKELTKQTISTEEVADKVLELFTEYLKTTSAILEDYVVGNTGMFIEFYSVEDTFIEAIKNLVIEPEEVDMDFDELIEKLSDLGTSDIEDDRLLNLCDVDEAALFVGRNGYATVKVNSLRDQIKLEEFLHTLYPIYLDYKAYVNI
jgi:hypothetical protein